MKICILNNEGMPYDTTPSYGGVQYVTQYLSEKLVDNGCEVHILTRSKSGKTNIDYRREGLWIHYNSFGSYLHFFGKKSKIKTILEMLSSPIYNIIIFNTLRKLDPEIVHCQGHHQILAAYLLKIIKGTPYVVAKHDGGKYGLFNRPFVPALKKIWYKIPYVTATDRYVCLTNQEKNDFDMLFGANSLVIPNGVDLSVFSNSNDLDSSKKQKYNILCVSRLCPEKGLDSLVSAIPKIREIFPKIMLFIVGDGELLHSLEKKAEEDGVQNSVIFLGSKTHEEIIEYYNNSQIYIMSSLCESFSLTILEATACGLAIISTPVGIAPEMINKWNNGVLINSSNPDLVADAVIDLFSNRDKLEMFQHNSLKARDTISWDTVAKRYINLYNEIIGEQQHTEMNIFHNHYLDKKKRELKKM